MRGESKPQSNCSGMAVSGNIPVLSATYTPQVGPCRNSYSSGSIFASRTKRQPATLKVTLSERNLDGSVGREVLQSWVPLTQSTANVPAITEQVRKEFGDPTLGLVTKNGLRIPENPTTAGRVNYKAQSTRGVGRNLIDLYTHRSIVLEGP